MPVILISIILDTGSMILTRFLIIGIGMFPIRLNFAIKSTVPDEKLRLPSALILDIGPVRFSLSKLIVSLSREKGISRSLKESAPVGTGRFNFFSPSLTLPKRFILPTVVSFKWILPVPSN